jgi:hypothetical protein
VRLTHIVSAWCVVALVAGLPLLAAESEWRPLFDGKSLQGWKSTSFGGEGEVAVIEGEIILERGDPLTGINFTNADAMPKVNYEIELSALKADGNDFFCGLTFPVEDSFCSLILGGWGGMTVGLSSIDGRDASDNATTQSISFDDNKWYKVLVQVTREFITCRLDEKQILKVQRAGKKFSVRSAVEPCEPLGIASYLTKARLKDIRIREIKP